MSQEETLTFYKNSLYLSRNVNAKEYILYTDKPGAMMQFKTAVQDLVINLLVRAFGFGIIIGLVIAFAARAFAQEPLTKADIKNKIVKAAIAHNVDPATALAIAQVESSFNPKAVGKIGEVGLFQFRPDMFDVHQSRTLEKQIKMAMIHFADLKKRCGKEVWVVCHNRGVVGTKRLTNPKLTDYYKKVAKFKKQFSVYTLTYIAFNN